MIIVLEVLLNFRIRWSQGKTGNSFKALHWSQATGKWFCGKTGKAPGHLYGHPSVRDAFLKALHS